MGGDKVVFQGYFFGFESCVGEGYENGDLWKGGWAVVLLVGDGGSEVVVGVILDESLGLGLVELV